MQKYHRYSIYKQENGSSLDLHTPNNLHTANSSEVIETTKKGTLTRLAYTARHSKSFDRKCSNALNLIFPFS